ncbi:MAG: transposase [Acidobacteriota bacterium]
MARPLRLEFPGAVYHVTSRGDGRGAIFRDDADRERFLEILQRAVSLRRWICHAYCLMGNHYHLLVETPEANLSRGMRSLNGEYTQAFNRRHRRPGHVFQGRFKAVVVEKESHLLELCRYVVLNPVRARGMRVAAPEDWPWSSYRATAGLEQAPGFLSVGWILSRFGGRRPEAQRRYARFVAQGKKGKASPPQALGGLILGTEAYAKRIAPMLSEKGSQREHPRRQRHAARPSLATLFGGEREGDKEGRNAKIREAYNEHQYTLSEIGRFVGLHYATVSRIVKGDAE